MSHLYYWSPGAATAPTKLGNDDHYFRLGEYIKTQEPASADIAEGGLAEGIFFYTSGKYSLKATQAMHQEVDGPVVRTVETGDLTYTNEDGDLAITVEEGGVTMTAEGSIEITAKQKTSTATTIEIYAGSNDVYYIQGQYLKEVTVFQSKLIRAHNHKTNIGLLISTHGGVGATSSLSCEITYSSFSVGFTAVEVSAKGIAMSFETNKNSMTMFRADTYSLIDGKKVFLDEEFCVFKNETRAFRFTQGIAKARKNMSEIKFYVALGMTDAEIVTHLKGYDLVF
jgi:hypothetical protein